MMEGRTVILVRNRFESKHCWPDAPDEVFYLRNLHRHVFYVDSEIEVYHEDRDLEFIMVQHRIDEFLANKQWDFWTSCESMSRSIASFLIKTYGNRSVVVSVREDNEHGAKFIHTKE